LQTKLLDRNIFFSIFVPHPYYPSTISQQKTKFFTTKTGKNLFYVLFSHHPANKKQKNQLRFSLKIISNYATAFCHTTYRDKKEKKSNFGHSPTPFIKKYTYHHFPLSCLHNFLKKLKYNPKIKQTPPL